MITRPLIFAAAIALVCPQLVAQTEEPVMDMEARRKSVVNLRRHIEQREKRLTELNEDMKRIDARIESRIEELVTMLSETRDSEQSRTRIAETKTRAIKGLRGMIQVYQSRRAGVLDELKRHADRLPVEQLNNAIKAFDERIEKRVKQIMELSASMSTHEDTQKYESSGGSYWGGWYRENTRVSDKWKQNRRENVQNKTQKDELIKALKEAIGRQEQRRAAIDDTLRQRKLSEAEREVQLEEIGRLDASIENRKRDLDSLITTTGNAPRSPVGRNQAHEIQNLIADSGSDLSDDFNRLLQMVTEYLKELDQNYALSENLKAREEWLKKNDTAGKSEN